MKKVQKVLALLLVFMMVFTTAGMNVAAAGEMDSVAGEADIQSQEQQQTLDEQTHSRRQHSRLRKEFWSMCMWMNQWSICHRHRI